MARPPRHRIELGEGERVVAPMVLELLGQEQPPQMTGGSLLA